LRSPFSCSGAYVIDLSLSLFQTVSGRGILRSSSRESLVSSPYGDDGKDTRPRPLHSHLPTGWPLSTYCWARARCSLCSGRMIDSRCVGPSFLPATPERSGVLCGGDPHPPLYLWCRNQNKTSTRVPDLNLAKVDISANSDEKFYQIRLVGSLVRGRIIRSHLRIGTKTYAKSRYRLTGSEGACDCAMGISRR
jgi:hypothetical protein